MIIFPLHLLPEIALSIAMGVSGSAESAMRSAPHIPAENTIQGAIECSNMIGKQAAQSGASTLKAVGAGATEQIKKIKKRGRS